MKSRIFDGVKCIFYALYASINEGYAYHASSLTYSFTMILGSLLMFSSFFASFLPFFDFNRLISYAVLLFPEQTEKVILEILKVYQHRASGSAVSLLLAYFFSVGFSKSLHRAFLYILSEAYSEKEWVFWIKTPALIIIYTLTLSLLFLIGSFFKTHVGSYTTHFFYIINFFSLWILALFIYALFLPKRYAFRDICAGATFTSLSLILLNKIFSLFVVKFVTLNPLYGFMGSVLLFFIWINLSFTALLAGSKYIQLMKEKKQKDSI